MHACECVCVRYALRRFSSFNGVEHANQLYRRRPISDPLCFMRRAVVPYNISTWRGAPVLFQLLYSFLFFLFFALLALPSANRRKNHRQAIEGRDGEANGGVVNSVLYTGTDHAIRSENL